MSGKKVLIVDDSAIIRQLIIIVAAKSNLPEPIVFEEAVDGLDGYSKFVSGHFDLVITDLEMPNMNGLELIGKLRRESENKNVPIMVLTAKCEQEVLESIAAAGANKYLPKPFSTSRFKEAVAELLGCKSTIMKTAEQNPAKTADILKSPKTDAAKAKEYDALNSYEQDFWTLCTFKGDRIENGKTELRRKFFAAEQKERGKRKISRISLVRKREQV